jgi:hypothetical protein
MNALERLRPEPQSLDAAWSAATLRHILASGEPAVTRTRTTVRRRVVASAAAAAAASVAVVVGSLTMGTSAAFAVEQEGNGDVVVTIHRLTDAAGLEKALREHGIDAQVTYLSTHTPSDLGDGSGPSPCAAGQSVGAVTVDPADDGGFTVTLERAYLEGHRDAAMSLTAAGGASADDWAGLKIEWSDGLC